MKVEDRIKKVMHNVFNIQVEHINDSTSLDTIEKWNSLGQMNLVMALEEEFNVQLSNEQIIEMMSYPLIICIIKEALDSQ